ncbi:farnesyl-diphosphate farnesyltransferase [Rickenella mellea]|uniref:Squalene synthase n=1 Tax=Rickenella mellea TaxID=50990 RepID=A0A4Y7QGN8_9AGAM|nr:farnesyl-diphosphate farnesyltransferase [Rickenella mellea]
MGASSMLTLLLTRPNEFRTLVQYYLWHEKKRDITDPREHVTSGYDRPSMRRCWEFLDLTSRSFSSVIKELQGDLARIICLYYLVLRALDTIEDDMTIPDSTKQPLMRTFHTRLTQPGWSFTGCGPSEKDRQLLVEFPTLITELSHLSPAHLNIIIDITQHMAVGMADYAHLAHKSGKMGLETMEDFDLYCHYVAGLVGEGLSRIFAESGKEAEWLGEQTALSSAMGIFLQKVNILRDFREDVDDGRLFWPRQIYTSYGFDDPKDMCRQDPENAEKALWALSAMTLDTLRHAPACLDYISLLRNQSVFNFCAIPQTMAMATLAVCFMNPLVFQRNVKIRKAEAARLIMNSTNPRDVAYMFRDYARVIHSKSLPSDPSFVRISVACAKLEQWCEHHFPAFVLLTSPSSVAGATTSFAPRDARSRIQTTLAKRERQRKMDKRIEEMRTNGRSNINVDGNGDGEGGYAQPDATMGEMLLYVGGGFFLVMGVSLAVIWVVLRFTKDD